MDHLGRLQCLSQRVIHSAKRHTVKPLLIKRKPFPSVRLAEDIHLIKAPLRCFKGAQSRFAHIEKISLDVSNSSFVIRVNLLHP